LLTTRISHDERFITGTANQLWVCNNGTVSKFYGDVSAYKKLIVEEIGAKKAP
jgi:ATP-binding cassette subfamily F protein 3